MYASETWKLKKVDETMIATWESKVLRRIFGPKKEIEQLYGNPNIIAEIKSKRISWLGHVIRMEESRIDKKLFNGKPGGRRKTGRPRLRWLDDVKEAPTQDVS